MNARHGQPSHQTVRLDRGKHLSPEAGVCVMELASMLAGEGFTDRPHSVCPVVAALARGYNDAVDSSRRQQLYDWASRAVGSRSRPDVEAARARVLHASALSVRAELPLVRRLGAVWRALREPPWDDLERDRLAAVLARELADRRDGHELAQELFDALLAVRPTRARKTVRAAAPSPSVPICR